MSRQKEYAKTDLSFDDLLRATVGVPIRGEGKKGKKKAGRKKEKGG